MRLLPVLLLFSASSVAQVSFETPVYIAGENGYNTYRIPAMVIAADGTALAFCEGRRDSGDDTGDIDIVLRRSVDGGKAWSPMQVVASDDIYMCGNPCPVIEAKTGDVILLFTRRKKDATEDKVLKGEAAPCEVWYTRSVDNGATWSKPADISADTRKSDWRWYATGPGHGIQLRSGRLLAPCNHSQGPKVSEWHSHVIYSDDGGKSWRIGGVQEGKTNESAVAELSDGRVYHNMRNYRGTHRRAYSMSSDGGITWAHVADDTALIEPVCQASLLTIKADRHVVLFSNPASKERENMTIRASLDDSGTWPRACVLHKGPAAYSDLAAFPVPKDMTEGRIACLYERGVENPYESIVFAVIDLKWLVEK